MRGHAFAVVAGQNDQGVLLQTGSAQGSHHAADLDIEKVARQWGADFPVGWMNERQRQRVEELMVELRGERTFSLPTSLLLLEDGSVGAYIEGPIELDEVQDYLDYLGGRL